MCIYMQRVHSVTHSFSHYHTLNFTDSVAHRGPQLFTNIISHTDTIGVSNRQPDLIPNGV